MYLYETNPFFQPTTPEGEFNLGTVQAVAGVALGYAGVEMADSTGAVELTLQSIAETGTGAVATAAGTILGLYGVFRMHRGLSGITARDCQQIEASRPINGGSLY